MTRCSKLQWWMQICIRNRDGTYEYLGTVFYFILSILNFSYYHLTSLQTNIVPKTIWRPSKKLSPMMMTVEPPVVQPSLGLMAFIHGVAGGERKPEVIDRAVRWQQRIPARSSSHINVGMTRY